LSESAPHPSLGAVLAYTRWAVKHSELPSTARGVAVLVSTYYNRDEGVARPSWRDIGAVLGIHEDTVYRSARACTKAGIWAAEVPRGKATRYRFPLAAVIHTPRASAGGELSTPPAPARLTPRASAG